MENVFERHPVTLRDYAVVIWKWKWFIAVIVGTIVAATVAWTIRQPVHYQARADVLLNSQQTLGQLVTGIRSPSQPSVDPVRQAETQATIAETPVVAERALKRVGVDETPSELLKHVSVTPSGNADVLMFTATSTSGSIAPELATAMANAYTEYRADIDRQVIENTADAVRAEMGNIALGQNGEPLDKNQGPLFAQLRSTLRNLEALKALQTGNALVVSPAATSTRVSPQPVTNGILALAGSLLFAVVIAFLFEALRRKP